MSLLCGCAGRKDSSSSPQTQTKMSKIKQPSTISNGSRFGFASSKRVPSKEISKQSSHKSQLVSEKPCLNGKSETSLGNGLALDPSALLDSSYRAGDCMQTFVPRNSSVSSSKARPVSTVVTISHESEIPIDETHQRSVDDTNPTGKPKSGLRSFLARPFSKEKRQQLPAANGHMSGSKSDCSLSSSKLSLQSSTKTASVASLSSVQNGSTTKKTKTLSQEIKPAKSQEFLNSNSSQSSHSKKIITKKTASTKSNQENAKQQTRPSQLGVQSKIITKPAAEAFNTNSNSNSVHNNNSLAERNSNIDSNGHTDFSTVEGKTRTTLSQSSTAFSKTSSMSVTDKKRPTIEICPLAKPESDDLTLPSGLKGESKIKMGLNKRQNGVPVRMYEIDDETLNSILFEINSLKNTVVELQHHLIGKQEHEDKMREELKKKNEMIANLHNQLTLCTCSKVNGFCHVVESDVKTEPLLS